MRLRTKYYRTFRSSFVAALLTGCFGLSVIASLYAPSVFANDVLLIPDTNGRGPLIDSAANGVPVIQINTPNAAGLSHNEYIAFSVGEPGLILNNAQAAVMTELAGFITANPQAGARPATHIVNEVTGRIPTSLCGAIEVAGNRADVIIANPNGITVNNGTFINASRATLVTGVPQMENGHISAYDITGGTITVEGRGLDVSNTPRADLLAEAIRLNAAVWADELHAVTGAAVVDAVTGEVLSTRPNASDAPVVALDVAALGGMYANSIFLIGTADGLGVNNRGSLVGGTIELDEHGKLTNSGTISSVRNLNLAADSITNHGGRIEGQALSVTAREIANETGRIAGDTVSIVSDAFVNTDGHLEGRELDIIASGDIRHVGGEIAGQDIAMSAANLYNDGTLTAEHLKITAENDVTNTGTVSGSGVSMKAEGTMSNTGTVAGADVLSLRAHSVRNAGQGKLYGGNMFIGANTLAQTASEDGIVPVIASTGDIRIGAERMTNEGGSVIQSGEKLIIGGALEADGRVTGSVRALINKASFIEAGTDGYIAADTIHNLHDGYRIERIETVAPIHVVEYAGNGREGRYALTDERIYANGEPGEEDIVIYSDESLHLSIYGTHYEQWTKYEYDRRTKTDVVMELAASIIAAGGDLAIDAEHALNDMSRISAAGTLTGRIGTLENINPAGQRIYEDTGTAISYWRHHRHGRDSTGSRETAYELETVTPLTLPAAVYASYDDTPLSDAAPDISGANGYVYVPTLFPMASLVPDSEASYVIETDPRFTDKRRFLSSDYFLERLSFSPDYVQKRLGDGYYEQQLVMDEILRQTGKTRLTAGLSAEAQYRALMDAGIQASIDNAWVLGRALTEAERSALETDVVWLVERTVLLPDGRTVQALVPTLYTAKRKEGKDTKEARDTREGKDESSYGIIGGDITLAAETVRNSGHISADNGLRIDAINIINTDGRMEGANASFRAAEDIVNDGGTIRAARNLSIDAGRDVKVTGGDIMQTEADGQLSISAGRDIDISTATYTNTVTTAWDARNRRSETVTDVRSSAVTSGGNLSLVAARDVILTGSTADSKETLSVNAGRGIRVESADRTLTLEEEHYHVDKSGGGHTQRHETRATVTNTEAVGSLLTGRNVKLSADTGIVTEGAAVLASEAVEMAADKIDLGIARNEREAYEESHLRKRGFLSKETGDGIRHTVTIGVEGTTVSGTSVTVSAAESLKGASVTVLGEEGVTLVSGGALRIDAAKETETAESAYRRKKTGLLAGGIGFTIGREKLSMTNERRAEETVSSVIASTKGTVGIDADGDIHLTSTHVASTVGTDIEGRSVTLDGNTDRYEGTADVSYKKSGLTVSLGGSVIDAVTEGTRLVKQAGRRDSTALSAFELNEARKKLQDGYNDVAEVFGLDTIGRKTASTVSDVTGKTGAMSADVMGKSTSVTAGATGINTAEIVPASSNMTGTEGLDQTSTTSAANTSSDASPATDKNGQHKKTVDDLVNLSLSLGSTSYKSNEAVSSMSYKGGSLMSTGAVNITARDAEASGIRMIGETVTAESVRLTSASDISLEAGQSETHITSDSKQKGWSLGANVSLTGGGLLGVNASANRAKSEGLTDRTSYVGTKITATDAVTLDAKTDIDIIGSSVTAKRIEVVAGDTLKIESLQETETYKERGSASGFSLSSAPNLRKPSGSVSASKTKIDSTYARVKEQAGLYAGTDGFDIQSDKILLTGAVLSSEADEDKNTVKTNTLVMTDIENSAAYTYKQSGIGYNHYGNYNEMSQDDKNSVYNNMGLVPNLGAGASDEATSVTKSAVSPAIVIVNGEQIDLAILNTDTANALNELETIFDKKSIEERQELARLFAQNTYEAIHRLGEAKGWKDGSIEKALLHTATAEITARLAGNAPGSGAIAGAVNELAVNEILTAVGTDHPDAAQILSAALGAVVNKAIGKAPDAGAAVAQYGTKWNKVDKEETKSNKELYEIKVEERGGYETGYSEEDVIKANKDKTLKSKEYFRLLSGTADTIGIVGDALDIATLDDYNAQLKYDGQIILIAPREFVIAQESSIAEAIISSQNYRRGLRLSYEAAVVSGIKDRFIPSTVGITVERSDKIGDPSAFLTAGTYSMNVDTKINSDGSTEYRVYLVDNYNFEKIENTGMIASVNNEAALAMQAGVLTPYTWHLYAYHYEEAKPGIIDGIINGEDK